MNPIIPQPQEPQYQAPTPEMESLSDKLRPYRWHIAISGVIIIAILFGAYSYLKYTNQQNDVAVAKQAEDAQKKIDEIYQKRAQNLTADWKTYTNTQYGFEFKYPQTAQINDTDSLSDLTIKAVQVNTKDDGFFNVEVLKDKPTLGATFDSKGNIVFKDDKAFSLSIGGVSTDVYFVPTEDLCEGKCSNFEIALYHNNLWLALEGNQQEASNEPQIQGIQKVILSTFGFTDSSALFCGGIAGKSCPSGYNCKLDGNYPDAGGTCVPNSNTGTLAGHVTIGPNCPVEQAGNPCTPAPQAYTSRQVMVYKADGATLVTAKNFDTQGNYSIVLPFGNYIVKSKTGIGSTLNIVDTITIKSGQTITLDFNIDTGIR